jgi:hypothetical protein
MIEGWGDNFDQKKYLKALEFGATKAYDVVEKIKSQKYDKKQQSLKAKVKEISEQANGNIESAPLTSLSPTAPLASLKSDMNNLIQIKFQELAYSKLYDILTDATHDKQSRDDAISQVKNSIVNSILKNELKSDSTAGSSIYNYNYLSEMFTKVINV